MLARITVTSSSLRGVARVAPVAKRFYADGPTAFHKKEKAHEDQYARKHEEEQLRKLKAQIEKKKAELAELEKQHAEELKNVKKE